MKLTTKYDKKSTKLRIDGKSLLVGIKGIKKSDDWRNLGFKITSLVTTEKVKKLTITEVDENSKEFVEGILLGTYDFKLKKDYKEFSTTFSFSNTEKKFVNMLEKTKEKITAQTITKDLINLPPNISNSKYILGTVMDMFKENVEVKVYSQKDLKEMGMEGHLAVNAASRNEAMVIKLTYTPKDYEKHNVYVGKGLTYDSGGLSIKPTNSMLGMQADKSGAMVLLGFMSYIEKNGSKNKITSYLSIAENMIDADSFRPGDILTMKNGMTVNIKNTDAEGRLVLFDSLCLAQEENKKFDTITSIATLTGSAVMQFGKEAAALVSFKRSLKKEVREAGQKAGEIFMNAAFHKYMLNGVDDSVADLTNTGTANMGCQKAGLFLSKSIEKDNKKKFIHWDIAGPSWIETSFGSNTKGATGFGVRTLIEINS